MTYTHHRHEYGDKLLEVFVVRVNSDQTEGRGPIKDHSTWNSPEDAHKAAYKQGVMGYGDGDIVRRTFTTCGVEEDAGGNKDCGYIVVFNYEIYDGRTQKWVEQYDPRINDPDYKTYLKLKKRFEK